MLAHEMVSITQAPEILTPETTQQKHNEKNVGQLWIMIQHR
jgi:hypothetical protein